MAFPTALKALPSRVIFIVDAQSMQHPTHQALPRAPRADLKMNTVIPEAEPTVLVANILWKQHFHLVAAAEYSAR
jgi:hypothetical protein